LAPHFVFSETKFPTIRKFSDRLNFMAGEGIAPLPLPLPPRHGMMVIMLLFCAVSDNDSDEWDNDDVRTLPLSNALTTGL